VRRLRASRRHRSRTAGRSRKTEIIRLSVEGQRAFPKRLLNPPEPSPGSKSAEAHRRLIVKSGDAVRHRSSEPRARPHCVLAPVRRARPFICGNSIARQRAPAWPDASSRSTTRGPSWGSYTLAATSVALDALPSDLTKRLPRYPLVPRCSWPSRSPCNIKGRGWAKSDLRCCDPYRSPAHWGFCHYSSTPRTIALCFYQSNGFALIPGESRRLFVPVATALRGQVLTTGCDL